MDATVVDSFLPKAAPTLPFNLLAPQTEASRAAGNQPSFDRYLQAAHNTGDTARAARPADRKAEPQEHAARPAAQAKAKPAAESNDQVRVKKDTRTKDDRKTDDSGSDQARPAQDDPSENAAAAPAAISLVATVAAQTGLELGDASVEPVSDAVQVVEMEASDAVQVVEMEASAAVQVVEMEASTDEPAVDGTEAGAQDAETGFTTELAQAETPEVQAREAVRPATQQIEQTSEAADDSAVQLADTVTDPGDDLAELEDNTVEVSVKREPAEPVIPAPPAPQPSDSTGLASIALRPGEQVQAAARPASGASTIAQPAAARPQAADAPVFDQVVRGASLMVAQGRSEIRVQLRPPELGTVRLHLVSDRNNVVDARIVTERDDVRQLVERNLTELRDALAGSGIDVGNFDVSTQHSGQTWDDSAGQSASRRAWDATESEGDQPVSQPSDSVRGVNRSQSAGTIDYII